MYYVNDYKGFMFLEVFKLIYRRWLPMGFIIMYALFVFQFTGSGPLFQFCHQSWIIGTDDHRHCNHYWWIPLVFGSSIFNPTEGSQCLDWLWIVSNEVIFFTLLIVIFYFYKFRRWMGYSLLVIFILTNIVSTFLFTYKRNFSYTAEVSRREGFLIKINPLNSASSFMIGVLFALMFFSYKNRRDDYHEIVIINRLYSKLLQKKLNRIITMIVGALVSLLIFFIPYPIFGMDEEWLLKRILSSSLMSIERQLFTVGVVLFLTPCVLGKARAFRAILGNRALIPLARLTNAALLVHGIILMWYFFGKYQILRIDPSIINMSFIALSILSYVVGTIFAMTFETPLITMESLLWCPKKRKYHRDSDGNSAPHMDQTFKTVQTANENLDMSDHATKDSVNEVPLYSNKKIRDLNPRKLDQIKRSNSLDDDLDFNNVGQIPKTLLNDSEDSKNYTSFNEPLISQK